MADGVTLLRGGHARTMAVLLLDDAASGGVVVSDSGERVMATPILRRLGELQPATVVAGRLGPLTGSDVAAKLACAL